MATDLTLAAVSQTAEMALFGPCTWSAFDTQTAATTTAVHTGVANKQHELYKVVVSFSAAPAGPLILLIKDGTTTIGRAEIPASATSPVALDFGLRPLTAAIGADLSATVASAGGSTVQTVWMMGTSIRAA